MLIERDTNHIGGHWYPAALALTHAARRQGRPVVLIALNGIDEHARAELRRAGAQLTIKPAASALEARALHLLARIGTRVSARLRRFARHRRFPHQITLLSRCAAEAAALRIAAELPGAVPVLLTASEGLPGLAALLGGPHVRITHDVVTTQDRPLRLLDRLTRRGWDRLVVVCPTSGVREGVACEHPGIPTVVRSFALTVPGERITVAERATARDCWGIAETQKVITLVGGWWPYKDVATIDAALGRLTGHPVVLVAGTPLDEALLWRWRVLLGARLRVVHHALTERQLRTAYAATDLLLVARRPGTVTESGLVCDAARHGIPLVVSDHDKRLCRQLGDQRWLRVFTAGDPASLVRVLDDALACPPARPGADAVSLLGLSSPQDAVLAYAECFRALPGIGAR